MSSADKDASIIDVRELLPAQRHRKIFQTVNELAVDHSFSLVNDHDPKPARSRARRECCLKNSTPLKYPPRNNLGISLHARCRRQARSRRGTDLSSALMCTKSGTPSSPVRSLAFPPREELRCSMPK